MNHSKDAIAIFDRLAQQYQDKYMDVELYQVALDMFCKAIQDADARVLEVGCGPGNVTKYILSQHPDYKIFGIDLSPKMIELARQNNPQADFGIMDARRIFQLPSKYNAVLSAFCLPYFSREEAIEFIANAAQLLLPNGVLYLSLMEGDYTTSGFVSSNSEEEEKMYIHFHEAEYLTNALRENGFKRITVKRQDYPRGEEIKWIDLLLIAEL